MKDVTNNETFIGTIYALLGAVFFSSKAVIIKLAYLYDVSTIDLLLLRMGFSLPFFLVIGFWKSERKTQKISLKEIGFTIFLGSLGYYLASFLDFTGLHYIHASLERLILFIYPTIVVLLSSLVFKKKIEKQQVIAIILSYVGILIVFIPVLYLSSSSDILTGGLWIFASAFTYAVYLVGSGQLIKRLGKVRFTSIAMITSCLCVIVHNSLINGGIHITHLPPEVMWYGLTLGIVCTVIPSYLISASIEKIGAGNMSIIASIGPISTIVLATIFLGETITEFQLIGTAVVICAIWVLNKK